MTTAATSLLGLALPVTGELSGTWGDTVNNSITSLLDSAVAGTTTLSTDADVTLTTTTLAANQAREAIILWTAAGTVTRTITAPAQSKTYVVINSSSTQSIKLVGAGPTAGITVLPGESTYAAWNGSDFVKVGEYGGNLTVNSLTTTASTTGSTNKGPLNYGTLSFSDTGIVQSAQTSVNSYFQNVIQNTSAGTAASAEFIAYNDQGTASTNYATVGINSSGYTGTGSINAPGYAYFLSASTDLVLGTIGANGIHFTTNSSATDALAISSAGAVSLPGGTANGVAYLNGSKVVTTGSALTYNGVGLGIGVASATQLLNVSGSGTSSIQLISTDFGGKNLLMSVSGSLVNFNELNGNPIAFGIGNSEQMRLTSTGLGIGTSSPAYKLVVSNGGASGIEFGPAFSGTANLIQSYNRSGGAYVNTVYDANQHIFNTIGTEGMRLTSTGLGIGTSSPRVRFQVTPVANGSEPSLGTASSGSVFTSANTNYGLNLGVAAAGYTWMQAMRFDGNATAYDMVLQASGGNLGIGTSSPTVKLHVSTSGNTPIINQTTGGATSYLLLQNTGGYGYLASNNNDLVFATTSNATERMRLDSSGNLGLGVTPSASTLPTIQSTYGVVSGNSQVNIVRNAYFGSNWTYSTTSTATQYQQASGEHRWFYAPSGTAGNAITFTQAMTLDASGNLLVGTTVATGGLLSGFNAIINGGATYTNIGHSSGTGSGSTYIQFAYAGTTIGSIAQSGTTAVLYNITSDQRLKENIADAASASALIDAIQVRQYDWKSDGSHQRYGFIAQELVTVAPEAVHQPADPEEMMAVDYSKLVPMLVKEIQDLRKRLAAAGI